MKHLISILLGAITLTATAQDYPLPSTRIYGSLQVDSAFRSDFDGTIFVNDSINIPILGWTTVAGAYALDGSNLNTAAYYPDGFGQALPSYVVRMANGDTVSNLTIFAGGNGVDQLFALEATIGEGKSGYEVQVVDGLAAAKMYATNFDGSTNLTVIEVDTTGVKMYVDDYNISWELMPSGMEALGNFNLLNNLDGTGTQAQMDTTIMNITYSERTNDIDYQSQLILNAPQSYISHFAQGIIDAAEGKIEFDGDTTTAYITLTADSVIAVGKFVARGDTIILDAPAIQLSQATALNGYVLTSDATGFATWQDPSSTSWSLAGNAGTDPDVDFLGTTDSIPLTIRANAASTEPNSAAGIYIEGSSASDGPGLSISGIQSRTTGGNIGLILAGSSADGLSDIQLQPANGLLQLSNIGESDGYVLTSDATGNATWQDIATADFSSVPAYANNTAAESALGPGKLYYTDVAGEYILKITH